MLMLYNTPTRQKEKFRPIVSGKVSMYTCGPTVYDYAHIGNFRAVIFYDLVRRYLEYKGLSVKHVMNVTDIDDKIIKGMKREGKSLKAFTEFYTKAFLEDIKLLSVKLPSVMPKATEHIKEMVELIMMMTGHTYSKNGSTYFKISSFNDYGKLASLDFEHLKENAEGRLHDADEYEKEDARDFALWKAYDEADGAVFWETGLGKGRPGWHIECSAMARKYLGDTFDLHLGGIDLVFPHHTNEIAQSEAATGKPFAKYWMHNAHLIVNGEKMSKSLGNFFTLRDLLKKGYTPKAIRYQLLATHYRQQLNFTEEALQQIPNTLQRLHDFLDALDDCDGKGHTEEVARLLQIAKKNFEEAMDDDLNISAGLAAVFNLVTEVNTVLHKLSEKDADNVHDFMMDVDTVLGVMEHDKGHIGEDVEKLIEEREAARKSKDFVKADKIRKMLLGQGIILEDSAKGVRWKRK